MGTSGVESGMGFRRDEKNGSGSGDDERKDSGIRRKDRRRVDDGYERAFVKPTRTQSPWGPCT